MGLKSVGFHSLRHAYRSLLDSLGTPTGMQQKLMRHAQISTTMNTYGGAFLEDKRKANNEVTAALLAANFDAVGFVGSPFRLSRLKLLMIWLLR
jgi:integrase